jgi:hypothetical protein
MTVMSFYIKKLIVPYPLGFYYGYSFFTITEISEIKAIIILIVFVFFSIFSLVLIYKKNKVLSFAVLILNISLLQNSTLFYPIAGVAADRYAFLPSIGFSIILAYAFFKLFNSKWHKVGVAVFTLLLISYSGITLTRNAQWKDKITLFEYDIKYLEKKRKCPRPFGCGLHARIHFSAYKYYFVKQGCN